MHSLRLNQTQTWILLQSSGLIVNFMHKLNQFGVSVCRRWRWVFAVKQQERGVSSLTFGARSDLIFEETAEQQWAPTDEAESSRNTDQDEPGAPAPPRGQICNRCCWGSDRPFREQEIVMVTTPQHLNRYQHLKMCLTFRFNNLSKKHENLKRIKSGSDVSVSAVF